MTPIHILNKPFTSEQTAELVDLLRKNFLYQEPEQHDGEIHIRMIAEHWDRMLELITEHGGWELPQEVVEALSDDGGNGNDDA